MNKIGFCNASYGFREYELEEVFTACKEIGILMLRSMLGGYLRNLVTRLNWTHHQRKSMPC